MFRCPTTEVPAPASIFEFRHNEKKIKFKPQDLDILINDNLKIYADGERVIFTRDESIRFIREYLIWLDQI